MHPCIHPVMASLSHNFDISASEGYTETFLEAHTLKKLERVPSKPNSLQLSYNPLHEYIRRRLCTPSLILFFTQEKLGHEDYFTLVKTYFLMPCYPVCIGCSMMESLALAEQELNSLIFEIVMQCTASLTRLLLHVDSVF